MMRAAHWMVALAGQTVLMASASAQIEAVYTKITGHATAVVPGARDAGGAPAFAEFRAMEDLVGSPDGLSWFLKGRTQLGADLETVLLLGSGATGTALVQEGQPALGGGFYDFIGSGVGRFDTAGNAAFTMRARTGATGSTSAADGQRVLRYTRSGGTLSLAFKQLDAYSGLSDTGTSDDETVGNSVGSIHLLDNGVIGCQDSTINAIATSRRPAIFYNRAMFHQTAVTSVTALGGLGARVWNTLDANEFYTTPDGTTWYAEGRIVADAGTLRVLVVNGTAVLQESQPVPGSSLVLGDIFQTALASSGGWLSRGRDNSASNQPDWVVRNGALVAQTGQPIVTGSTENWGDVFSSIALDAASNYAISGNTSSADLGRDTVIVYNGTTILAREGDPVDLNGNGLPDDNVFIGRGNNTLAPFLANASMFLSTDGYLYFLANLRDGDGIDLNTTTPTFGTPNALLRVRVAATPPCDPDFNQDGNVDQDDVSYLINVIGGGENPTGADPDFNHDGNVDQDDVGALIDTIGGGPCP